MSLMTPVVLLSMALGAVPASLLPISEETQVYAKPGGHALKLTLRRPRGVSGPCPGLVLVHGGGWTFGNRLLKRWYGREFARRGYVTIAVEYRKIPRWTIVDCIHDVKSAVRWLRAHADEYQIDPERIAILGDSAGGHLALMMAATRPEDGFDEEEEVSAAVQAAVSLYPVTSMEHSGSPETKSSRRRRAFLARLVGQLPAQSGDPYRAISPMSYVHGGMAPVLLIHGTADPLVSFGQSVDFYQRLRQEGVPVRLVSFPRWGHGFDYLRPNNRRKVLSLALDFLDTHMASHASGEPG